MPLQDGGDDQIPRLVPCIQGVVTISRELLVMREEDDLCSTRGLHFPNTDSWRLHVKSK